MEPANDLDDVRALARDENLCVFYRVVLEELRKFGLDSDDLRFIIETELGKSHCFKSKTTERYFPGTTSDYYSIWIDECSARMFIKLLIEAEEGGMRLVITSFKKDTNYDC